MKWIIENVKWIFSGIGVAILSVLIGLFYKSKTNKSITQSIKSGNNSTNIQGGKNVTMTNEEENNE